MGEWVLEHRLDSDSVKTLTEDWMPQLNWEETFRLQSWLVSSSTDLNRVQPTLLGQARPEFNILNLFGGGRQQPQQQFQQQQQQQQQGPRPGGFNGGFNLFGR